MAGEPVEIEKLPAALGSHNGSSANNGCLNKGESGVTGKMWEIRGMYVSVEVATGELEKRLQT